MPPRVTDKQKDAALRRIQARHRDDNGGSAHLLTDDPSDVLEYLRRRGVGGLRSDADGTDVEDALDLRVWLWWQGEAAELWLLKAARQVGLPRRRVGAHLGLTTGQGLLDREREKRVRLYGEADAPLDPEPGWLASNRAAVHRIARVLVDHWALVEDDNDVVDWLEEVRRDLRDRVHSRGSISIVGQAVDELLTNDTVLSLGPEHPLRMALNEWAPIFASLPRP